MIDDNVVRELALRSARCVVEAGQVHAVDPDRGAALMRESVTFQTQLRRYIRTGLEELGVSERRRQYRSAVETSLAIAEAYNTLGVIQPGPASSGKAVGEGAATGEDDSVRMLTATEVAALFRVDPKTVTRWAAAGRLPSVRTPGNHHRFREDVVMAMRNGQPVERDQ